MKILIITSCTGEKAVCHPRALSLEDFKKGPTMCVSVWCWPSGRMESPETFFQVDTLMLSIIEPSTRNSSTSRLLTPRLPER
jgi:hypothetical protein